MQVKGTRTNTRGAHKETDHVSLTVGLKRLGNQRSKRVCTSRDQCCGKFGEYLGLPCKCGLPHPSLEAGQTALQDFLSYDIVTDNNSLLREETCIPRNNPNRAKIGR